jgi:transposase
MTGKRVDVSVEKIAGMLKGHLDGVLRFVKHPITNGVAEGLNSKIMSIKRKSWRLP